MNRIHFLSVALTATVLSVQPARGQSTWTGATSGSWNVAGNWSPPGVPANGASTQLTFDATSNATMTADIPATLNVFNLNQMTFTANAPAYSVTGDTLSFHNSGMSSATITVNSPNTVTIGDPVTMINGMTVTGIGTGAITLNGVVSGVSQALGDTFSGTLVLTAANTYTGGTSVVGATISIPTIANGGVASPLGASSNAISNLGLSSLATRGNLLLTGTNATYSTDRGVSIVGSYSNNSGGAIGVQNAGTTLTWNGQVIGPGTLVKFGAGTLALTNTTNQYADGAVVEGGTLAAGANGAVFPVSSTVTVQPGATFDLGPYSNASAPVNALGTLNLNGGALRATGATNSDFFVSQINMTGGTIDFTNLPFTWIHVSGGITVNANATPSTWLGGGTCRVQNDTSAPVTINAAAVSARLGAGIILSNGGTNPYFTISGPGWVRLSNTGNTANITVNGGHLYSNDLSTNVGAGAYGTLGTGSVAVTNNGFLYYDGPTATSAKPLTVSNGTIEVVNVGTNLTLTNPISESAPGSYFQTLGPLDIGNILGMGTVTVVGNNNYSGATFVGYGGILAVPTIANGGLASPIGSSSNAPANLYLGYDGNYARGDLMLTGTAANYSTDRGATVRGFYGSGVQSGFGGGGIGVQNAGTTLTWNGPITGTGQLIKSGSGTLVLTNTANSFQGGAVVEGGTLTISGPNGAGIIPAGTSVTILAGAQFNDSAFVDVTQTASALGTISVQGGAFILNATRYFTNQLSCSSGSTVNLNGNGLSLNLINPGAAINITGNSTWLGFFSSIVNLNTTEVPINIAPNATLTTSADLIGNFNFTTAQYNPYRLTGGGTLYMTGLGFNGSTMTVSQGRLRVDSFQPIQDTFLTLDGGTLQFSGPTTSSNRYLFLGVNGGTVEVSNAATTLTLSGYVGGFNDAIPGPFTKAGPGVLALTYIDATTPNRYFGGVIVNAGRLEISDDAQLAAAATITVNQLGTMRYTASTTTARTFLLNSGTMDVSSGATLTLNGATVGGGFLRGPGSFTVTGGTFLTGATSGSNTTLNVTGPATLTNFTNGSTLNFAAGAANPATLSLFTDQGSGSITVASASAVNASDFQTYGLLTINAATAPSFTQLTNTGTTPLYFNGGSRTFIGTPATAGTFVAGIDLHGQNAVVAGGLFVNNGYVVDSTNSGAVVVADYGALVKGAGFFQYSPLTQNGGRVQAGNSPGSASFGQLTFGPGGVSNYVFAIDDATGTAGPRPDANGLVSGWGLMKSVQRLVGTTTTSGDFAWTADATNRLTFAIETLVNPTTVGTDVGGLMADFDPSRSYSWPAVTWSGTYSGPTDVAALDASTIFDTTSFENPRAGTFGWSLDPAGQTLSLTYTPTAVPEPGTLALTGLGSLGLVWSARRRRAHRAAAEMAAQASENGRGQ